MVKVLCPVAWLTHIAATMEVQFHGTAIAAQFDRMKRVLREQFDDGSGPSHKRKRLYIWITAGVLFVAAAIAIVVYLQIRQF